MSIDRGHAVDIFKLYGGSRYSGAQKFPIDIYKDSILLYEFVNSVVLLVDNHKKSNREQLKLIIRGWNKVYRSKNFDHDKYGGLVEMMYRRKIEPTSMKAFLQSVLLNTTNIKYDTYDELKVYIYGVAESVAIMMCNILGSAPPGFSHAQAIAEAIWLIHMLHTIPKDIKAGYCYIPLDHMQRFGVTYEDVISSCRNHLPTDGMHELIKYYIHQYQLLMQYGLQGVGYINPTTREGVMISIKEHQDLVTNFVGLDYNIFHPKLVNGVVSKITSYSIYFFASLLGKKH